MACSGGNPIMLPIDTAPELGAANIGGCANKMELAKLNKVIIIQPTINLIEQGCFKIEFSKIFSSTIRNSVFAGFLQPTEGVNCSWDLDNCANSFPAYVRFLGSTHNAFNKECLLQHLLDLIVMCQYRHCQSLSSSISTNVWNSSLYDDFVEFHRFSICGNASTKPL